MWGCPRQDAHISTPTLFCAYYGIMCSYEPRSAAFGPLLLLVGRFPKTARTGSRNPANPWDDDRPPNFGGPGLPPAAPRPTMALLMEVLPDCVCVWGGGG